MELTDTAALADQLLADAREASASRAGMALRPGKGAELRQTVLALLAGAVLAEHENPGEATLLVLRGRVRVTTGEAHWDVAAGEIIEIPPHRHGVTALEDSAFLLTTISH